MLDAMLYIDTKTWLPDDLLIKADKMTMANSLELRVPLLDHKVLEFAAALPANLKVHGFTTKYLAKMALENRVPRSILESPEGRLSGPLRVVAAEGTAGLGTGHPVGPKDNESGLLPHQQVRTVARSERKPRRQLQRDFLVGHSRIMASSLRLSRATLD